MRQLCFCLVMLCGCVLQAQEQLTLDYCLAKAEENYPVIKKYDLVERTSAIELSDINKTWLPQASVYAQGTVQNVVPQFPDALSGMLDKLGQDLPGLGKVQYKVGVDLNQTVWDGGVSKSQRESVRARDAERRASLDVEMYAIRGRVENLYFGLLLIGEQMQQTRTTLHLLDSNLEQMKAMQRHGVAMQSDVDMLEAQKLTVERQLKSAEGSEGQYRRMLEVFIGEPLAGRTLQRPSAEMPRELTSERPELHLLDARTDFNNARSSAIEASLMPKIGLFAQAYYGYPGFDYFAAMRTRDMSFNVMAGVKVSWNISSLYTRRNNILRITLSNQEVEADRDKFLFETGVTTAGQLAEIESMRKVMADDSRIATLRANVRQAAESQLRNGVIDSTALLAKITDENQANLTATYHEIELLRLIYQLKNTLNR